MNKNIFVIFIILFVCFPAYTQYSADLSEDIYKDISIWEGRAYIRQLPNFRPLPETVLVDIMKQVMEKGDYVARKKAEEYFDKLSRFLVYTDIYTNHYVNIPSENNGNTVPTRWYGSLGTETTGASFVGTPLVSIAVGLGFKVVADKDGRGNAEIRNYFFEREQLRKREEIPDSFGFGSLASIELKGFTNARTSLTIGKPNIFMQAGFMRRSVGPFFDDGLIVSSRAPQTGNIFVHWSGKHVSGTWGLFMLTSKREYVSFNGIDDFEERVSYKFNKVFFYNSLAWFITPDIEMNVWESVMFGDFNFAYLLPIKIIYAIDALSDFVAGNLMFGISFDFRVARTLKLPFVFIIDDINVNDLIRFRFDTKLKIALQTGLTWTPIHPIVKKLAVDYQLVLPYTYTHVPSGETPYSTEYNTKNHAVRGEHLATTLNPSSHRIRFSAEISPIKYIDLAAVFQFSQHNNPSAGILNGPKNDGSIVDDGYYSAIYDDGKTGPSFQNRNGFLQGTIEHTLEFALNIGVSIPINYRISVYGDASYSLRYLINYNLVEGLNRLENAILFDVGMKILFN